MFIIYFICLCIRRFTLLIKHYEHNLHTVLYEGLLEYISGIVYTRELGEEEKRVKIE